MPIKKEGCADYQEPAQAQALSQRAAEKRGEGIAQVEDNKQGAQYGIPNVIRRAQTFENDAAYTDAQANKSKTVEGQSDGEACKSG